MYAGTKTNFSMQLAGLSLLSLAGCARPGAQEAGLERNSGTLGQDSSARSSVRVSNDGSVFSQELIAAPKPQFEIPELSREVLSVLDPSAREPLIELLSKSLSSPETMTPHDWVEEMSNALTAGGMSEGEIPKVLGGYVARGLFPPAQYVETIAILHRRYPEDAAVAGAFAKVALVGTDLPSASVLFSWTSSAGGNLGLDALSAERSQRFDPSWAPENAWDLPINVNLVFDGLMPQSEGNPQPRISLTGTMEGLSDSGKLLWSRDLEPIAFTNPASDHNYVSLQIQGESDLPGGPITIRITYEIAQQSPEGFEDSRTSRFRGEHWTRFVPVTEKSAPPKEVGYREVPLGLHGQRLENPSILSSAVFDVVSDILVTNRKNLLERLRAEEQRELLRHELIGSPLSEISLSHDSKGAASTLALRREGTSILVFGATWCGPCGAIAPEVEAFIQSKSTHQGRAAVYRFSVDDPEDYGKAVNGKYPDGVITPSQGEALTISSVPAYVVTKDGRIVDLGVLGPGDIERLAAQHK